MVRAILAAVGLVLAIFGVNGETEELIGWGILLIAPAAFTIIFKVMDNLSRTGASNAGGEMIDSVCRVREEAEEEKKRSQLKEQRDMLERFKTSELTNKLLLYICNGSPEQTVPEKITIHNDRVEAILHGRTRVFDFASRRIHSFPHVIETVHSEEELEYVVRPQIAMAEALNSLLSDRYVISDSANWERNYYTDSDRDMHTSILYTSVYTTLTLKDTLPNQSF